MTAENHESGERPSADGSPGEKPIVGATEVVEVCGTDGTTSVVARSDTGAVRTSIDTSLAAEIGAGPITDAVTVRSAVTPSSRVRPVLDLVVGIGDDPHVVAASVEDRRHMDYAVLLGRDVLEHYHVDPGRYAEEPPRGVTGEDQRGADGG